MESSERPFKRRRKSKDDTKLDPLPKNATVSKRPLMRPPLPSPYASAASQKVVYVSAKTPFMSAVKRCERLLHLTDKRLVQSAVTLVKQGGAPKVQGKGRQTLRGRDKEDNIDEIVEVLEEQKAQRKKASRHGGDQPVTTGEEVVIKGTGKAIAKVLEIALWFQQREETYTVRLRTATTSSIDDVAYEEDVEREDASGLAVDPGGDDNSANGEAVGPLRSDEHHASKKTLVERSRIRKLSVLEVYVSLR